MVGVGNVVDAEIEGIQFVAMEDVVDAHAEAAFDIGVTSAEERGGEERIVEATGEVAVGIGNRYVIEVAADDDRMGRGIDGFSDFPSLRGALDKIGGEFCV